MLITTNQAAHLMRHTGLNRDRSRLLLATGIAGAPVRTRGAVLYDEARVQEVERRRFVTPHEVTAACPQGILVGRLPRTRTVDATAPGAQQREAVSGPWRLDRLLWLKLMLQRHHGAPTPFVATVTGYIIVGADVVDFEHLPNGRVCLQLVEAGDWFERLRGRRWLPGRGGAPLMVSGWQPFSPVAGGSEPAPASSPAPVSRPAPAASRSSARAASR